MLAVSLSESIGSASDGVPVPTEIRIQALNKTIQGVPLKEIEDNVEASEEKVSENSDAEDAIDTDWQMWANTLYQNAKNIARKSINGSIINACFNPDFATCLKKKLIPHLPLWTGIMRRYFEESSIIATSSSVESEFNDLKHRAFDIKLPTRIDKFVLGKMKLASNERDLPSIEERDLKGRKITNKEKSESCIQSSRESELQFVASELEILSDYESHKIDIQHDNRIDISHNNRETPVSYEEQKSTEREMKRIECKNVSNIDEIDVDCEDCEDSDPFINYTDIHSSTAIDYNIWNTCENWREKAENESKRIPELKESPIKKRAKLNGSVLKTQKFQNFQYLKTDCSASL